MKLGPVIARRLQALGYIKHINPDNCEIERCRSSKRQQETGAFSWFLRDNTSAFPCLTIGSIYPAKEVARAKHWECGADHMDLCIYPSDKP